MKQQSILFLLMPVFTMPLRIDKDNGGYYDVLVAIEESAGPNETVVEAVKVLLRAASLSLHRATGGRVHLASVTLAIPRHWPRRPGMKQVSYDPLSRADIRIVDDGPGSLWPQLQAPVAQPVAACGQPGERVLFPMAALPMNSSSGEAAETVGYQLAREWARYRYGVLGEFAATGDVWYAEDACNGTFPAACTNSSENASGGERWGDKPCDPMSAWQLITGSDDFKGLRSRNDNEPIVTTFRQIQQNKSIGRHLIMVFDVSDTDKDDATVTKLKETVAFVLVDKLAQGAMVSLVYFFNGSSFHAGPMTLLKASKTDISRLVLLAPMQGPTCTLCALRMTLQVLSSTPKQSIEGSLVILFSDGKATGSSSSSTEESSGDFLSVVPDFQRERVIINTVAVGASAPRNLEKLALETGGRTYAVCDKNANVVKGRCWMGVVNAFFDTTDELPSAVESSRSRGSPIHYKIGDDRTSGLLQAQSVLCHDAPIRLQVRVPEYVDSYRAAVVVASLTKGQCPVVHASVKCLVFFQNSSTPEEFTLHDSGLGEDVHANDGTYTGQFTKFRGSGRYTVVIEVTNKSQTEFLDWTPNNVPAESSPTVAGEQATTDSSTAGVRGHSTGAFSETAAAHPLFVNQNIIRSQVPPGRVRDLKASFDTHEGRPTARLSWTMPGAHAFEGTVSSINLRTSRSIQTMLDFFHKATEISEQDLLSGSMKPLPAFSQQLATISIPSTIILGQSESETTEQAHSASGYNVYFTLVTTNNYGSRSEVSNLASVNVPAHFTVPEGMALADATVLVHEKVLKAENESEGTDASLQLEKMTISPWGELLSIPVSADADATPSAAPETSHAKTALKTKKATISKKTTKPHNSASPVAKNKKRATSFTSATAKRKKVVDHARAAPAEEDSTLEPHSDLSTTPVNGSDADMNVTYPPPAEKKAVNKFDEDDDDGTLRAWILFAVFMIACLLICLNLAFLYCRAQFEVDDGPPGAGESVTSGYGTGF